MAPPIPSGLPFFGDLTLTAAAQMPEQSPRPKPITDIPTFRAVSYGVNFNSFDIKNYHNESYSKVSCDRSDWFDDVFSVRGYNAKGHYVVTVAVDSGVPTPLWNKGMVAFFYDGRVGHWITMMGFVPGEGVEREWKFCDPGVVVDRILAGLKCFQTTKEGKPYAETVARLAGSIEADREFIVKNAVRYPHEADCTATPEPHDYDTCSFCPPIGASD